MSKLKKKLVLWFEQIWYRAEKPPCWLTLLTPVYRWVVKTRRCAYALGIKKVQFIPVPVIVVGNLTVGGTGKTPLTIRLARFLSEQGYRPGIVSRGYGGDSEDFPRSVHPDSDFRKVGDEALVTVRHAQCPVVVCRDRVAAVRSLLKHHSCNVILSDDGLQHYALSRDIEIAVVDSLRRFGNGYCLPAGPMREPLERIAEVDIVVYNGRSRPGDEFTIEMDCGRAVNIRDPSLTKALSEFSSGKVHLLAGIGNPQRFFDQIAAAGLHFDVRRFPDHYRSTKQEISFEDNLPVLMTEKDAVKCTEWVDHNYWFLPVHAIIHKDFGKMILKRLSEITDGRKNT